jgi:hypothetical protein
MSRYIFYITLHSRKLFLPLSYQLLLIVISVIHLLHFQHLRGSDSKKHKKYMNCHEHIGTKISMFVVCRLLIGCTVIVKIVRYDCSVDMTGDISRVGAK